MTALLMSVMATPMTAQATMARGAARVYGSGVAGDDKNNMIVDGASLSHRFRASTTSPLAERPLPAAWWSGLQPG